MNVDDISSENYMDNLGNEALPPYVEDPILWDRLPYVRKANDGKFDELKNANLWPSPVDLDGYQKERQTPNLVNSKRGDLLTELSKSIGSAVQFPPSTVFLHGLGVVASAMCKSFKVDYYGKKAPITLFTVTAQPPSTGKSGVNEMLSDPLFDAYKEINKKNRAERVRIETEIAKQEKRLDQLLKEGNPNIDAVTKSIEELQEELNRKPDWTPYVGDTTMEAAEYLAAKQTGMVNIVSAEAESVTVVLGNIYNDDNASSKKTNFGFVLSMWDGERVAVHRVGREGYKGRARGCISVIAQDESIDAILKAGQSGRGIAERFLLLAESHNLGKRDHSERKPINPNLIGRYQALIQNIVNEEYGDNGPVLKLGKKGLKMISDYRNKIEPELADGGKYQSQLLQGVMGKADKQIIKIACILHTIEHWQNVGDRKYEVDDFYVFWGIKIFEQLSQTYINAADSMGYLGDSSEVLALRDKFEWYADRGKLKVELSKLVNDVKKRKPFNGIKRLTSHLRENAIPELERLRYIYMVDNTIYINPRLR